MTTQQDIAAYFAHRLAFETDASDVRAAQRAGDALVVVDVRSAEAFAQGHVPGAVHMPYREIAERAPQEIPLDVPVVVYCWSPGCNAGHKGALAFAEAGYRVREMLGGFEYWVREGYRFDTADGSRQLPVDPLTGVVDGGIPNVERA